MCENCWAKYGSPTIDSPKVRAAADAIEAVHDLNDLGGGMHAHLEDWNLEDKHFRGVAEAYLQNDTERRCFQFMREMSVEERASALALVEGYFVEGHERQ
jgi:hypothetical protein